MAKKLSMALFGLALALGGCGGGDAPKTGCDGLGTKIKEMFKKEMEAEMKGASAEEKKAMEEMKKALGDVEGETAKMLVTACKEDKWDKAVIDCALKASTDEAMQACKDQLTEEQKKKWQERDDAMEKKMQEKFEGMMGK